MAIFGLIGKIGDPLTGPLAGGAGQATLLLSGFIRLITIGAGVYAMINFANAGIGYISSAGNPEKVSQARDKIYNSMIGLVIVVLSFAFAGILGLLLFGNSTAILIPEITGP